MQLDGSGTTAGLVSSNVNTGTPLNITKVQSKNGNIFTDGIKESVIIAATKQLTKKDKRGSSAALQAVSIDTSDGTYIEKASPSMQMKRKSSSIDVTSNGPITNIDIVQLSSFSNGNPVINEECKPSPTSANGDYAVEGNMTDTNSDLSSIISEHNNSKPTTANSTTNNNMQISQV